MASLLQDLLAQAPILTDGAWGTQLQAAGLKPGEVPDLWNLTQPDQVRAVAAAYVEAGSQIVLTNTFGATRPRLEEAGCQDKISEISEAGARLSREAAGDRAKVFASIGPTGKMLMMGEITAEELSSSFKEQAAALAHGGADAIVIETMADPEEAKLAVGAAKETGLPVAGCMVFDSGENKDRTMMGTTPEEAAAALTEAGADVVGANCGQGIAGFVSICKRLKASTDRPIWIKANAGLPELKDGKAIYTTTPEEFVSHVPALIEAGASFIGGCCGTSPKFIQAVRAFLDGKTS